MTVNLKKTCILLMLMLELVFLPVKAEATEMVLSQRTITIPTGSSTTISLENYNGKNSVKWRSTFQTVLKVKKINNTTAKLTAVVQGTARCQAIVGGKTYTCRVYVKNNPRFSRNQLNLEVGKTGDLQVLGTGSVPKWSVTNSKIASIRKISARKYRITAKAKGSCLVKAVVNGKTLQCTVNVNGNSSDDTAKNTEKAAVKESSAGTEGKTDAKRYMVSANYHYTNTRNTLGYYPTIESALKAINSQKSARRGEWYVVERISQKIVWPELSTNAQKIQKAIDWAYSIASDPKHGYTCLGEKSSTGLELHWGRWGSSGDYSCSTLVATAYELAGFANLREICRDNGYTIPSGKGKVIGYSSRNAGLALEASGMFTNVTSQYKAAKSKKSFLQPGDIVIRGDKRHVAMYYGNGRFIEATMNEVGSEYARSKAGDQTGNEIKVSGWQLGWGQVWRPKQ